MNLFEMMGIDVPEKKETKKEAGKTEKKPAKTKKEDVIDITNDVKIVTGYYPVVTINKQMFDKDSITYAELIEYLSKERPEFVPGKCAVSKMESGAYMVEPVYSGSQFSEATKLSGSYQIRLADFSTEVSGEVTKASVMEAWQEQYPEFAKVNFGYDEDAKIIVPLLEKTPLPKESGGKIAVKVFGREEFPYEGDYNSKALEKFVKENYPELEDNFYLSAAEAEGEIVINAVPHIKTGKAESVPKREMFPTKDVTLSLAFTRFELNPEMFDGQEEVDKETLLKKVQEDYGEYTEARTVVEYDKKAKMILLILKSSKKGCGCVSVKVDTQQELLELDKKKENFIARYWGDGTLYRVEKTPVGMFIAAENLEGVGGFRGFLPPIPLQIMNEIYHFFRMVDLSASHHAEAMAQIYWDRKKAKYFVFYPEQAVRPVAVDIERSHYMESKYVLVMDVHSHNVMAPFFSSTDDCDEKGTRLYCVFGHITGNTYDFCVRAGTNGNFIPVAEDQVFYGFTSGLPVMPISEFQQMKIAAEIEEKVHMY